MTQAKKFLGVLTVAGLVLFTAFTFTAADNFNHDSEANAQFSVNGTVTAEDDDSISIDSASKGEMEISTNSETSIDATGHRDASVDVGDHVLIKGEVNGNDEAVATSIKILGGGSATTNVDVDEDEDSDDEEEQTGEVKANASAQAHANANANLGVGSHHDDEDTDDADENTADVDANADANVNANVNAGADANGSNGNGHADVEADANIGLQVKSFVHGLLDK